MFIDFAFLLVSILYIKIQQEISNILLIFYDTNTALQCFHDNEII